LYLTWKVRTSLSMQKLILQNYEKCWKNKEILCLFDWSPYHEYFNIVFELGLNNFPTFIFFCEKYEVVWNVPIKRHSTKFLLTFWSFLIRLSSIIKNSHWLPDKLARQVLLKNRQKYLLVKNWFFVQVIKQKRKIL
jgi:hypothetical protein